MDNLGLVWRRRWIAALATATLTAAAVGAVALSAPAVAATVCPQCYGLESLGGGAYADRDDDSYPQLLDAAGRRLTAFYGSRASHPRILICSTEKCYHRIGGGGEKGQAVRNWSLLLSPAGANETIATHELSHVEFHERLGPARSKVPHWFDEGLAVLVSDDSRYLKQQPEADRCLLPYDQAASIVTTDWATASTGGSDRPYRQAACVVSRWTGQHGGSAAILQLIADLRAGSDFTALVKPGQ
jgi:hypothetical protein